MEEKVYIASYNVENRIISIRAVINKSNYISFNTWLCGNEDELLKKHNIKNPVLIFATAIDNFF